jgi:putative ABC transport system permease protein
MAMTARERVSEYAVMKTLGFRAVHIVGLIFGESLFIAGVGGLLGLAISIPIKLLVATAVSNFFNVFKIEDVTMLMAFGAAIIVGLLAAIFPALKAVRTPVVEGLRIID